MDNRLQATFMPRQAPGANDAYVRPKGPLNFLMAIAFCSYPTRWWFLGRALFL